MSSNYGTLELFELLDKMSSFSFLLMYNIIVRTGVQN